MKAFSLIASTVVLFGCGSLPATEQSPSVDIPERFINQSMSSKESLTKNWWMIFDDSGLSRAVELALTHNHDLEQARLRVEQSRALAERARSRALPRVDLGGTASANRLSTQTTQGRVPGFDRTTNVFSSEITASWELDLFGRTRAAIAAEVARTQASEAEAVGLSLILSAETARRVIELRGLQAQDRLTEEAVQLEDDIVSLVEARLRGGLVTQAELLRARSQLHSTKTNRERLKASLADAVQALAVLLATTPTTAAATVGNSPLPEPKGLETFSDTPAEVLSKRPDVLAAEFRLKAASADLTAIATERFPRVNLLASVGLAASGLSSLGTTEALLATLAPSLSWRALDFGDLEAAVAGRKAAEKAAAVAYKQAVMTAFSDAETALSRVAARHDEMDAAKRAANMQQEVWEITRLQFESGVGELSVALEARRLVYILERERVGSQQALAVALIEGYRATAAGITAKDQKTMVTTIRTAQR